MNELEALLFLTHVPFLGSIKIRLLIQHFGSAAAAAKINPATLIELPGFGPKIIRAWQSGDVEKAWEQTLKLSEQHNVQIIPFTNPNYPKRLLDIIDFPLILYVKGSLLRSDQQSLAIVGTRQASIYGMEMTYKISAELAHAGFTIVSGLARGIDTAAHTAACVKGRTIAVLGSGFNHIYPKENEKLSEKIIERGALISEFPMTTPPDRQHFPQRNRIVSGMTMGTILMEAPKESGAIITTELALNQGRKVFALPGRADQENFQGNHYLIKNRRAELIENSKDVIIYYSDLFVPLPPKLSIQNTTPLEKEEEDFIRQLPTEELSIEDIINRTKIPISKLNVLLMSLVLKKILKEYPGKIYKKV
ncbi:MAG: DNA-protecting protein DprA [Parachlamydiaceae bacterium]|nr:DNA-protecting protein DprA [Parachlamydiaceae bacterium]